MGRRRRQVQSWVLCISHKIEYAHNSNVMLGTRKLEEMLRNTGGAEGRGWSGEQWE